MEKNESMMSKKSYVFLLALFILLSCEKIDFFSRAYVATVNGEKIYLEEYRYRLNQKMAMLPKDVGANETRYINRLEEEVLENMITEKIMQQRARELNISVNNSELENKISEIKKDYGDNFVYLLAQKNVRYDHWKEELKRELLIQKLIAAEISDKIRISNDDAEDYYNDHRNNYRVEALVRVAQIVVRDLDTAKQVLTLLNAGEDFAALAEKYSTGPEASNGGDLGYITRDVMPEPLDDVIFKLPPNKISHIAKSSYGFHIFKVTDVQKARTKSFEEVKEEIIAEIRAQKEEAAFVNWLNTLRLNAVVKKESAVLRKKVSR